MRYLNKFNEELKIPISGIKGMFRNLILQKRYIWQVQMFLEKMLYQD